MWQSYRSNQAATFYIVWTKIRPILIKEKWLCNITTMEFKLQIYQIEQVRLYLTKFHLNFEGQTITGRDIPTYLTSLKSKGVDIDATTTNPETGEEEKVLKNKPELRQKKN